MGLVIYEKIGECSYCDKPAEILFIKHGFSLNWRLLCKKCAKMHSRVRDDVNANHI